MSAKVDVLAVFDAYRDVEGTGITQAQHDEARAAVAVLIRLTQAIVHPVGGCLFSTDPDTGRNYQDLLTDALAACGVKP